MSDQNRIRRTILDQELVYEMRRQQLQAALGGGQACLLISASGGHKLAFSYSENRLAQSMSDAGYVDMQRRRCWAALVAAGPHAVLLL